MNEKRKGIKKGEIRCSILNVQSTTYRRRNKFEILIIFEKMGINFAIDDSTIVKDLRIDQNIRGGACSSPGCKNQKIWYK